MSEAYTVFWTIDRWLGALSVGHKPLPVLFGGPHLSEPSFRRAGVRVGDLLYPVGVSNRLTTRFASNEPKSNWTSGMLNFFRFNAWDQVESHRQSAKPSRRWYANDWRRL